MREKTKFGIDMDESFARTKLEEIFTATCELLTKYLVGWKNMGSFAFGCDVREFLGIDEARDLLRKVYSNQHVTHEEKKS